MMYKLKLGDVITTIPTIGFNIESVQYKNVHFTVWDVGGRDRIRALWRHYYVGISGIIFVVDSNDRGRMDQAKEELDRLQDEDLLRSAALLVLANKQDLPNAMSSAEVVAQLNLHNRRTRRWFIQATCATSGDGLYEGLEWLSGAIAQGLAEENAGKPPILANPPETEEARPGEYDIGELAVSGQLTEQSLLSQYKDDTLLRCVNQVDFVLQQSELTHLAMIRILWLHLRSLEPSRVREGRQKAAEKILEVMQRLTEAVGRIFSLTQTYFWIQLVDLALHTPEVSAGIEEQPDSSPAFCFIARHAFLANERLITEYYTPELILYNPASRTEFMLPDLKQLPSILNFNIGK
eukprot:TRINITY_DN8814_c0_g1_i2.p1 TRINITY_DN8814_c0_g1~~TRINITY_DN8814_c0_g1_i2.p1  ORF type:complete len:350 (+),score=48.71 TRINITY_DN8814_c0_g1_i2:162-1211(+)